MDTQWEVYCGKKWLVRKVGGGEFTNEGEFPVDLKRGAIPNKEEHCDYQLLDRVIGFRNAYLLTILRSWNQSRTMTFGLMKFQKYY